MTSVKFDYSGQYLAVGGQDARIYGVKQDWGLLATMSDLPKKVCSACKYEINHVVVSGSFLDDRMSLPLHRGQGLACRVYCLDWRLAKCLLQ